MSTEPEEITPADGAHESQTLRVIGWFSIGMAVAAVSIYFGAELRKRYKFNRRTPYDFYSNADEQHASEFGMGI
ncbi:MAG: hypothetical protein ABR976_13865 [Terracidiphilus sp.]|jgi:hypothetical protein